MKTIYFYGIDNNIGGMEVYAFNLIKDVLSKTNEFKFHIISQFEDFSFKKELVDLGCEFTIVPSRKKHPFKYSKQILNILKNAGISAAVYAYCGRNHGRRFAPSSFHSATISVA